MRIVLKSLPYFRDRGWKEWRQLILGQNDGFCHQRSTADLLTFTNHYYAILNPYFYTIYVSKARLNVRNSECSEDAIDHIGNYTTQPEFGRGLEEKIWRLIYSRFSPDEGFQHVEFSKSEIWSQVLMASELKRKMILLSKMYRWNFDSKYLMNCKILRKMISRLYH